MSGGVYNSGNTTYNGARRRPIIRCTQNSNNYNFSSVQSMSFSVRLCACISKAYNSDITAFGTFFWHCFFVRWA